MKLSKLPLITIGAGILVFMSHSVAQNLPKTLAQPSAFASTVKTKPVTASEINKKELLFKASNFSALKDVHFKLFTHALLTPKQPYVESAALFLERPTEFDPLRDLISFYGSTGNPAVRFYPNFTDRPYLVTFIIANNTGGKAEYDLDFGPAAAGSGAGEGFITNSHQISSIQTGTQQISFVVHPKKWAWHWVSLKCKNPNGLWNIVSAEVTYLK